MRVPKLGDIVLYQPTDEEKSKYKVDATELPAIIVRVFSTETVNLKVFNDGPIDIHIPVAKQGTGTGEWDYMRSKTLP